MLLQLNLAIAAGDHDRRKLRVQKIMKNAGLDFDNQTRPPSCSLPPFRGRTCWKLVGLREERSGRTIRSEPYRFL